MEFIQSFDAFFFELINHSLHNALLDEIVPLWRNKLFWIPLYFFLILFFWMNFKRNGIYYMAFTILTIAIADVCSSHWIKPTVERARPCHTKKGEEIRLLVPCGGGYSFPSSHAANHFALAAFLCLTLAKRFRFVYLTILWAASISLGQVYVGVHYPSDVIAGGLLGFLIGALIGFCYFQLSEYQLPFHQETST